MSARKKEAKKPEPFARFEYKLGRVVPGLDGVRWVEGKPVALGSKRTLIECFATDCFDTEEPYLCQLSKAHRKKLTVCALTCEPAKAVEGFLETFGKSVYYAVGRCSKELWDAYMKPSNRVPHAFLVNAQGRLLWHGNPYELDGELDALLDEERMGALLAVAEQRDRALALHLAGKGLLSGNPHRDEIRALVAEVGEHFEEDEELRLVRYDYGRLLFGERAPSLGKVRWLRGERGETARPTLYHLFALDEGSRIDPRSYVARIQRDSSALVDVVALTASPRARVEAHLKDRPEVRFSVGMISEEVYSRFVTEQSMLGEDPCFLVDADGTFLWSGEAMFAAELLRSLQGKELQRERFAKLAEAYEFVEQTHRRKLRYEAIDDADYERLQRTAKTVLELVPCEYHVARALLEVAQARGAQEVRRLAAALDTERLDATMLRALIDELHYLSSATMPHEALLRWTKQLLQLEPDAAKNYTLAAERLEAVCAYYAAIAMLDRAHQLDPSLELGNRLTALRATRDGAAAVSAWLRSQPVL